MAPLLQEMEQFTELLRRKSRLKHYLDSVTTQKLELKRESGVTTLIEMSSNTRKMQSSRKKFDIYNQRKLSELELHS